MTFEAVTFHGGPFDVPAEVADGRTKPVVLAYEGVTIGAVVEDVPKLAGRLHVQKGADGPAARILRNPLVLVVADGPAAEAMRRRMKLRLKLQRLKAPDRLGSLAEHQQETIRDLAAHSEQELATAIQQGYRHVLYP